MNSAPHLLPEDRPEFERALDEALRTARHRPALAALGERLTAQQLRAMALSAAAAIAACAAEEYDHFVDLRTRLRDPANAPSAAGLPAATPAAARDVDGGSAYTGLSIGFGPREEPDAADDGAGPDDPGHPGRPDAADARGGRADAAGGRDGTGPRPPADPISAAAAGAGVAAMASVLVPVLAGTAAVIFLLVGYLLHVMTPEPSVAAPMRGIGWVFAVLAAAATVAAMVGLWLTALRNGADTGRTTHAGDPYDGTGGLADEVARARAAWREALLERGILPFLGEALADPTAGPGSGGPGSGNPAAGAARTPRLGYSHPEFSSHVSDDGTEPPATHPRYSSPDYSSPGYGGPEHLPE